MTCNRSWRTIKNPFWSTLTVSLNGLRQPWEFSRTGVNTLFKRIQKSPSMRKWKRLGLFWGSRGSGETTCSTIVFPFKGTSLTIWSSLIRIISWFLVSFTWNLLKSAVKRNKTSFTKVLLLIKAFLRSKLSAQFGSWQSPFTLQALPKPFSRPSLSN